jgi:hypothetical protein
MPTSFFLVERFKRGNSEIAANFNSRNLSSPPGAGVALRAHAPLTKLYPTSDAEHNSLSHRSAL